MLKTLTTLWFPNGSQERMNLAKLLSTSLKKPAKVLQPPISQGCKKKVACSKQHRGGEDYDKNAQWL